jgi:FHA domain
MTAVPPTLVGLSPGPVAGWRLEVSQPRMLIGSAAGCDIRLPDPRVGDRHAELVTRGGRVWVEDLGSAGGTLVNQQRVRMGSPRQLNPEDVVEFAGVPVRFEAVIAEQARFDIRDQAASGDINNVARDHYRINVERRDSMLRDIAATRTRARWLIVFGALVTLLGGGMFAAGVLGFMSTVLDGLGGEISGPPTDPFGTKIAGLPSGLLGWVLAMVGVILMIIGIVLHIVATARRRRVDQAPLLPFRPGEL